MNIPTFVPYVWIEEDKLSPQAQMYHDELNRSLQDGLSDNGWTVPREKSANIIANLPSMPDGTIIYNTDVNLFIVKINGALNQVTTSAWP